MDRTQNKVNKSVGVRAGRDHQGSLVKFVTRSNRPTRRRVGGDTVTMARMLEKSTSIRSTKAVKHLVGIVAVGVVLAMGWQLVYRYESHGGLLMASPSQTFASLLAEARSGLLWTNLAITGSEFGLGLCVGVVAGLALGMVLALTRRSISGALKPWVSVAYSTPLIALTPLFILYFGLGIGSKVAVVFLVALFPVALNTATGLEGVDQFLDEMLRSLGASKFQRFKKLIWPSSIPQIAGGIRLAIGRGVTAVVAAELLGSTGGMGYNILSASQTFNIARLFADVIVLAIIGGLLMQGVNILDRSVQRWKVG